MKKNLTATILLISISIFLSAYKLGGEEVFRPKINVKSTLLPSNCSHERSPDSKVSHVMLHFCSNAAVTPENPYQVNDILTIFKTYKVSAHYLIGRDGTIYHLVDESRSAHHAGKGHLDHEPDRHNDLNGRSIGIELMAIGTQAEMQKFIPASEYQKIKQEDIGFTAAQYRALNTLLKDIETRHNISHDRKHVVGHDEYAPTRRSDPGSLFEWSKIGLN